MMRPFISGIFGGAAIFAAGVAVLVLGHPVIDLVALWLLTLPLFTFGLTVAASAVVLGIISYAIHPGFKRKKTP